MGREFVVCCFASRGFRVPYLFSMFIERKPLLGQRGTKFRHNPTKFLGVQTGRDLFFLEYFFLYGGSYQKNGVGGFRF